MSIIFGMRKPSGASVTREEMLQLSLSTARYALDGSSFSIIGTIGMGLQNFHTHYRSALAVEPIVDVHGNMVSFDGRLDNHAELRRSLDMRDVAVSDPMLVLAAFCRWKESCFSQFTGDWALSLWSQAERVLYLARDHAGTRSLYFQSEAGTVKWATYLETLVCDGATEPIDQEFVARYLAIQPLQDLTPYRNIRSVPPAHYLAIQDGRLNKGCHWKCSVGSPILYRSDAEYEDHFRRLFTQAVDRRTAPGDPVLAELSGGMDSTSIVCISDDTRRAQQPEAELLDTVSYFDDSEPNWNERPYFSLVEKSRGKAGIHIPASLHERTFEPSDPSQAVYLLPGADSSTIVNEHRVEELLGGDRHRVVISGIGGDEVLGGVATPFPELSANLMSCNILQLSKNMFAWCLVDRAPLAQMFIDTIRFTVDLYRQPASRTNPSYPWISPSLSKSVEELSGSRAACSHSQGTSPLARSNALTWHSILETLPHLYPPALMRREYRFPYLDRDLVDFLFRVPREQLVRPGRRRSLMRRALVGIVPEEVLERRRKAFLARSPLILLERSQVRIESLFTQSLAAQYGFLDDRKVRTSLSRLIGGVETESWPGLVRAINLELLLRANPTIFGTPNPAEQIHRFTIRK